MKLETRVLTVGDLEVRQLEDGGREFRGYAIRFGEDSENLGGFIETVDPEVRIDSPDVRHLINHDANLVLGRTTAGTTELRRDTGGIYAVTAMPDTSYARDLAVSIERGDVNQMSFGFRVPPDGDEWDFRSAPARRTLRHIELHDVSTVTYPAYPTTTAEVRSLLRDHGIEAIDELDELRERLVQVGLDLAELRAGKSISGANADRIRAIASAHESMAEHISALADAAGLSEDADEQTQLDGGESTEYNARPRELDELRVRLAIASVN